MNKNVRMYLIGLALITLSAKVFASTYIHDGKEVTKGEAIVILVKDPKAKIQKMDLVSLDLEKGTLKNRAAK